MDRTGRGTRGCGPGGTGDPLIPSGLRFRECDSTREWDGWLSLLGGHPLQSALWGEAKRVAEGREDLRLALLDAEGPLLLARVEKRPLPGGLLVGWVPKGPAFHGRCGPDGVEALLGTLEERGFHAVVLDPYSDPSSLLANRGRPVGVRPCTQILDLAAGKEALLAGLPGKVRWAVRASAKRGVVVAPGGTGEDARAFFRMCVEIGDRKKFDVPGSEDLVVELATRAAEGEVHGVLLLARAGDRLLAGSLLLLAGRSLHLLWSAVVRGNSDFCAGEALRWAEIEYGLDHGALRYDLEGLDPVGNPGTYAAKKKWGGEELHLGGKQAVPLGIRGRALTKAMEWFVP